MIKIGLTGSIGSGKSTVSRGISEKLGIPVFDADAVVHELYKNDDVLKQFMADQCGGEIIKDGAVDKAVLGQIFKDPTQKKLWDLLEAKIHERVWAAFDAFVAEQEAAGAQFVIADVPLLFEKSSQKRFDYTVNVYCPREIQKERALARPEPKLTEAEFERRYAMFMPIEQRNKIASFAVDNSGSVEDGVAKLSYYLARLWTPSSKIEFNPRSTVYIGSFDPPTRGHLAVIMNSAILSDNLSVGIGVNPAKTPTFSVGDRIDMIETALDKHIRPNLPDSHNVRVAAFNGMAVDFMISAHAETCFRGVRGVKDWEEEKVNRAVYAEMFRSRVGPDSPHQFRAQYASAPPELEHVSSSTARQLWHAREDKTLRTFVTPEVAEVMIARRDAALG